MVGRIPTTGVPHHQRKGLLGCSRARPWGSENDPLCSCAEENLLAYPGDPYSAECILIHEFAHNIHLRGLNNLDETFDARLRAAYEDAMRKSYGRGSMPASTIMSILRKEFSRGSTTIARTIMTTTMSTRARNCSPTTRVCPKYAARSLGNTPLRYTKTDHAIERPSSRLRSTKSPDVFVGPTAILGQRSHSPTSQVAIAQSMLICSTDAEAIRAIERYRSRP